MTIMARPWTMKFRRNTSTRGRRRGRACARSTSARAGRAAGRPPRAAQVSEGGSRRPLLLSAALRRRRGSRVGGACDSRLARSGTFLSAAREPSRNSELQMAVNEVPARRPGGAAPPSPSARRGREGSAVIHSTSYGEWEGEGPTRTSARPQAVSVPEPEPAPRPRSAPGAPSAWVGVPPAAEDEASATRSGMRSVRGARKPTAYTVMYVSLSLAACVVSMAGVEAARRQSKPGVCTRSSSSRGTATR